MRALLFALLLSSISQLPSSGSEAPPPNILFIAIDDLRPELGCYDSPIAITPNLDALAADGLRFDRAYCQQSICSPSRASLMTGARPDTIGITENTAYFRDSNPDIITLPQHFIANGYEAVYSGKIYHNPNMDDREKSWSRLPAANRVKTNQKKLTYGPYALPENQQIFKDNGKAMIAKYGENAKRGLINGPAFECADVPDHTYPDGRATLVAIETLNHHLETQPDQPLFLALGMKKPHLHFIAPKKYWDLYDPADIPLATHPEAPIDGAATGLHASFELRVRHGIPKTGDFDPELSRTLKHAYLACVSYVDAQIGLMLDALDESGTRDNTIVIVWGDHGWHLGDMGVWGKATNYEIGTRVPLILWTPDMKEARGKSTDALVELIDIYPTLCDLTGIVQPNHLEGKSLAHLLTDPTASHKPAANLPISQSRPPRMGS